MQKKKGQITKRKDNEKDDRSKRKKKRQRESMNDK